MKSKISIKVQLVTPAQAKAWMTPDINDGNRHISQMAVDGYASEMKGSRWIISPDAIAFDTNGKLRNGQHRLSAIIQSGVACEFLIMEGVDEEDGKVFDQGRARTVSDMLKMFYGVKRATMVTGVIRTIDLFVNDQYLKLSVGHASDMISTYSAAFTWAVESIPGRNHFSQSPIVAALVYAYKTSPSHVESFTRKLCSGADLAATSPILLLRNHLLKEGTLHFKDQKKMVFNLTLTAVDCFIRGQSRKTLRAREDIVSEFSGAYAPQKRKAA